MEGQEQKVMNRRYKSVGEEGELIAEFKLTIQLIDVHQSGRLGRTRTAIPADDNLCSQLKKALENVLLSAVTDI